MDKDLMQKIDSAAEEVAGRVFYHYMDSTDKEKLKDALKQFAVILLETLKKETNVN